METVLNEWLRELIDYECLIVYSFESKVGRKWEVKIMTMATVKAMVKKSLKRKDGKCKVIIRLNHKGQEASIKNEW